VEEFLFLLVTTLLVIMPFFPRDKKLNFSKFQFVKQEKMYSEDKIRGRGEIKPL